jgi:hypothetical protein
MHASLQQNGIQLCFVGKTLTSQYTMCIFCFWNHFYIVFLLEFCSMFKIEIMRDNGNKTKMIFSLLIESTIVLEEERQPNYPQKF